MANIIERPDGSTCTDPWPNFPFPPRTCPFIPVVIAHSHPSNEFTIDSDVAMALAGMKEQQRRSVIEALIRAAMERRAVAVSSEIVAKSAEQVADQLDAGRLSEMAKGIWPPDSFTIKLKYDTKGFGGEASLTWKF